jgi:transposase
MGNPAGVKRDFDALEQRRFDAFALLKRGVHQAEVARRLDVHRQSVSRWAKQIEQAGHAGLKKAGRAGRKPRLKPGDLKRIERKLKRGPQAMGYESDLWTLARVADLIEQYCGVRFTVGHVWWLLGNWAGAASVPRVRRCREMRLGSRAGRKGAGLN